MVSISSDGVSRSNSVFLGHVSIVSALLSHEADIDLIDIDENTPLHYVAASTQALQERSVDIFEEFLKSRLRKS